MSDTSGTTTYSWNARNQLIGISNTSFAAAFTYDSFGRRTGKTINGVTTNFVYDGLNPVQEQSGGMVMANLLTGLGIDEFFMRTDGVGASALLTDALGSTIALGDGTGTLQTQYTYEPFGSVSQAGQASTNSYTYTGREDDGSGLYYYRARYYHPRLQRFISEDPIGFAGRGINLYSYVKNSPMILIDPFGLWELKLFQDLEPIPFIKEPRPDPDSHVTPRPDPFQKYNPVIMDINRGIQRFNQCKTFDLGGPPGTLTLNGSMGVDVKGSPVDPSLDNWGVLFQLEYRF